MSYNYNPIPPRAWSRVQNPCTFIIPGSEYNEAFIPLTGQIVSQSNADKEMKMIYKGNILQHKNNSARLTKSQKYSQFARCTGPNRTKVFATQTETYTNPNTTGLLRSGYVTYNYPNEIVGAPNNISGPFSYNIPNPNDCSGNSVQDGGILVCGTYANPCSGEIYKQGTNSSTICNENSASNVPGFGFLCWNKKIQTWFPKSRYFMNNSTNKWPQGYKGFVSSLTPASPILTILTSGDCGNKILTLYWTIKPNNCIPITGYNIYIDNKLFKNVGQDVNTYSLNLPDGIYKVYIKSLSNSIESYESNSIELLILNNSDTIIISSSNIKTTYYNENGYTGIILETTLTSENPDIGYGEASFTTCKNLNNVNMLIVGGGGGGGGGLQEIGFSTAGGGGGGAGINLINSFTPPINTLIQFKIGVGGQGGKANSDRGGGKDGYLSSVYINSSPNPTTFISNGGYKGFGAGSTSGGGGNGGSAIETNGIGSYVGYGGGGGGGAYSVNNNYTPNKGLGGSGYTTPGNDGVNGIINSSSGSGGSSAIFTFSLPFLGTSIYVGGGGGGGGTVDGGKAGNGNGGNGGNNLTSTYRGQTATNYGGGGGGGAKNCFNTNNPLNSGGNGGNGVIIIWWQN